MTSKSQEPLTRPDKPVVINSDVKVFEALHGSVLRDWPLYHIHEVIAWYAWHAPVDGVRGREARLAGSRMSVALGAKDRERPGRLARMCTAQAVTRCFGPRFPPQFLLFKQLDRTYPAERRGLRFLRRADCAFPSHHRPGGRGAQPPARLRGGLRRGPQASAWGPAARKDAVWAEGLADGAPWVRPGHHEAASCGLRRCRELRIMAKTDRS